jgi:hypothetical protein
VPKLNENEIREILKRAEQIHVGASLEEEDSDSKALIKAAEEAGLPREAIEQALRERLGTQTTQAAAGDFIFAPSTDGKLYIAEFIESNSHTTRGRFLTGGEISFPTDQAQPAQFLPGSKVQANWPNYGWWTCTVISFDKPNRLLRLSDGWGNEKTFPLAEVRFVPPRVNNNDFVSKVTDIWERNKIAIIVTAGIVFLLSRIFLR